VLDAVAAIGPTFVIAVVLAVAAVAEVAVAAMPTVLVMEHPS